MRKTLLLLSVLAISAVSFAQPDLYFADANGDQITGDINCSVRYDAASDVVEINPFDFGLTSVVNKSSSDLKTLVKREVIGQYNGLMDKMCWAGCQDFDGSKPIAITGYKLKIKAGVTIGLNAPQDFQYVYKDADKGDVYYGKSVFKYTLMAVIESDTISYDDITVTYELLHPTAIADSKTSSLNVYPNPANGNNVSIKLNSNINNNSLVVIRDVIGKQVAVYNVNNIGGEMDLNVSNLNNGMFFVNIENNNTIISSSKLLINK